MFFNVFSLKFFAFSGKIPTYPYKKSDVFTISSTSNISSGVEEGTSAIIFPDVRRTGWSAAEGRSETGCHRC